MTAVLGKRRVVEGCVAVNCVCAGPFHNGQDGARGATRSLTNESPREPECLGLQLRVTRPGNLPLPPPRELLEEGLLATSSFAVVSFPPPQFFQ